MSSTALNTESLRLAGTRPASSAPANDAGAPRAAGISGFLAGVGERELVRRAQGGSVEAFGALVERFEGRVLALLRFRLRPEVDAQDVAQETFIRAWTRLDQFESGRDLAPWLLTIAARTAVAHNRKARSHKGMIERAASLIPTEEGVAPSPPRSSVDQRIWDVARGCLSEQTVTALWLRYGEGMSMREIGTALGWSEIHVRVALSRARKRLGVALKEEKDGARSNWAEGWEADHE